MMDFVGNVVQTDKMYDTNTHSELIKYEANPIFWKPINIRLYSYCSNLNQTKGQIKYFEL